MVDVVRKNALFGLGGGTLFQNPDIFRGEKVWLAKPSHFLSGSFIRLVKNGNWPRSRLLPTRLQTVFVVIFCWERRRKHLLTVDRDMLLESRIGNRRGKAFRLPLASRQNIH